MVGEYRIWMLEQFKSGNSDKFLGHYFSGAINFIFSRVKTNMVLTIWCFILYYTVNCPKHFI